jgi:hypothetical protein
MSKKDIAKAMYLSGEKPCVIAKKLKYKPNTISNWACVEGWDKERQIKTKEAVNLFESEIKELTTLAITKLNKLLKDPVVKDSDRVAAIRCALDISGLKNEKKNIGFDAQGLEVIINQIPL